jgi:hypothetical protein
VGTYCALPPRTFSSDAQLFLWVPISHKGRHFAGDINGQASILRDISGIAWKL